MTDLPDIGLGVPEDEPDEDTPPEPLTDEETRVEGENDLA
jgi:hypothetical protein